MWDGTKYVAVDYDTEIDAIKIFTETYTVTGAKQVQVTAPTTSTEYVYVPAGTLKAEKGMTWAERLVSDYNTTGETNPTIKTANFEDVSNDSVILADKDYGFMSYTLSGTWQFNDTITSPKDLFVSESISFTYEGMINTDIYVGMYCEDDRSDDWILINYMYIDTALSNQPTYSHEVYCDRWHNTNYQTLNFGFEPQEVSKEFYEWFTANATKINIIPEGGVYYVGVQAEVDGLEEGEYKNPTATYYAGEKFPKPQMGDVFVYDNYEYRYNQTVYINADANRAWKDDEIIGGWGCIYLGDSNSECNAMLEYINDKPVVHTIYAFDGMTPTFADDFKLPRHVADTSYMFYHSNMTELPANFEIPYGTVKIESMFSNCYYLTQLSDDFRIPETVLDASGLFHHCIKLQTVPKELFAESNVVNLDDTFNYYFGLKIAPVIPETIKANILATKQ